MTVNEVLAKCKEQLEQYFDSEEGAPPETSLMHMIGRHAGNYTPLYDQTMVAVEDAGKKFSPTEYDWCDSGATFWASEDHDVLTLLEVVDIALRAC